MTTAADLLNALRQKIDTTKVSADDFGELVTAVLFYNRGGHTAEQAAELAIEEVMTPEQQALIAVIAACDGCGRGTAKVGKACDHCGEIIECVC